MNGGSCRRPLAADTYPVPAIVRAGDDPYDAAMSTPSLRCVAAGFAVAAGACGQAAPPPAATVASRVTAVCSATSNLPPDLCACIGTEAETLEPSAQKFLVAMLEKDEAQMDVAKREASLADAAAAGTFMVRASATCARRQQTNGGDR